MARAARARSESGFYHVILRGNGRQILFECDADRLGFLELLRDSFREGDITLLAWCLMDNHVHLLVEDTREALSCTMQKVATTYALQYNTRSGHIGHVFQQRFHSFPIEDDSYLLEAMRYIHNNSSKAGVASAASYRWSSYHEYLGESLWGQRFADTRLLLEMLGGVDEFVRFSLDETVDDSYQPNLRPRIPDDAAAGVLAEVLADLPPSRLKSVERDRRDAVLLELKRAGLSIRQIERLTGIGRNIVARAGR
ncbi:REP element-mobilizing transposase RayT [Olsenella sp. KH3B4]|uniref:transposase n=1 Tax=Olsenella sp. KH3B4 TaxID=1855394 RepID=UPI0008BB5F37|nr:transposase [Olsenella sp. KH3B4]SET26564.1 REP element-mobilizing transposase RayT [Olsenella sp. KH3B4]